jgi:predicted nucleic acid-binding protein
MNADRVFVDSNVLIYAYDNQARTKRSAAKKRLDELWSNGSGVVSVQVLQEFFNNATRKLKEPLDINKAREIVSLYSEWVVAPGSAKEVLRAADIMPLYQLSFWDSLIIAAAETADAKLLLSEAMQHDQIIAGVRIENPFKAAH